jgi:L-alanine-DL-glutamate epimerase-like enolase superfamily enzyme
MAASAAAERTKGCRRFQVKVGGENPEEDVARLDSLLADLCDGELLLADANGAWSVAEALAMMGRIHHPGLRWEEPCKTYDENREAAERSGASLILDQCMSSLPLYARLCADGFAAGVGLKPTVLGGLSAARVARDLCAESRVPMKIDDSWGADVASAAVVHLAAGLPGDLLIATLDMRVYFNERAGEGGPRLAGYSVRPSTTPGLGTVPDVARLGSAVIDLRG